MAFRKYHWLVAIDQLDPLQELLVVAWPASLDFDGKTIDAKNMAVTEYHWLVAMDHPKMLMRGRTA